MNFRAQYRAESNKFITTRREIFRSTSVAPTRHSNYTVPPFARLRPSLVVVQSDPFSRNIVLRLQSVGNPFKSVEKLTRFFTRRRVFGKGDDDSSEAIDGVQFQSGKRLRNVPVTGRTVSRTNVSRTRSAKL